VRETGHSLLELLFAVALLLFLMALGLPGLRAYSSEAHILGAAEVFRQEFRKARSSAISSNRQTAIRFEETAAGPCVSVYEDGNRNGVLSEDIARGVEPARVGPAAAGPGRSERAHRDPSRHARTAAGPRHARHARPDPLRPRGDGELHAARPAQTPGTFYLAGDGVQAAIRVVGDSGRIRLLIYRKKWSER
jgi:type II secretory pathway pseudopilin PulG